MRALLIVGLASVIVPSVAHAQTAFGTPGDPAPGGLPGIAPGVSRTAPSGGAAPRGGGGTSKVPPPQIVTESKQKFDTDQRKIDQQMNICSGCD